MSNLVFVFTWLLLLTALFHSRPDRRLGRGEHIGTASVGREHTDQSDQVVLASAAHSPDPVRGLSRVPECGP